MCGVLQDSCGIESFQDRVTCICVQLVKDRNMQEERT